MSGIALSRETHPASDLGLGLGLEDRTPLVTDNAQVVLALSARFERSEVAYFYFEVYGPDAQLPADGGAFCAPEDRFGLVQQ
jgi:hypothetical protein